ncbi:MAG: hypothetical protein QHG99_02500 [Methanomicrobiales archaeon]|nr:hypothetical protein [Methanomicrobiales archaeon]
MNSILRSMVMKGRSLSLLIAISLILASGITIIPAAAESDSRYSYITVKAVGIYLQDRSANIQIEYELDPAAKILVILLGKSDLKSKLTRILNYENAPVRSIDLASAVFSIDDEVIDYGDGAYWFPEHRFGVTIPSLTITTPQTRYTYRFTDELPKGFGYFRAERAPASEEL